MERGRGSGRIQGILFPLCHINGLKFPVKLQEIFVKYGVGDIISSLCFLRDSMAESRILEQVGQTLAPRPNRKEISILHR